MIRALAQLIPRHSRRCATYWSGRGRTREQLERLAQELGVAERFRFTGALPHDQARAELARGTST